MKDKSGLKAGLTKKEGFKPDAQNPPSTSMTGRPKHDNSKIKRHSTKAPCC